MKLNMVDYNIKYKLDTNFEIFMRDNQYLFVDFEQVKWFRTNSSGYDLIIKMKEGNSIENSLAELGEETGFDVEFLKKQFDDFINDILNNKIIISEDEESDIAIMSGVEYPNTIWVHVTNRCNLKCQFCYSDSKYNNMEMLDHTKVLKFLDPLPKEHRKKIIISGGEPFLYSDLGTLVKGLKDMGFYVQIITNGTVGYDRYPEIIPYIDLLQVSVDGTTENINSCTRGKYSLHKTIEHIEYAKKLGVKDLYISFTATKYNIGDLPNLPEFLYLHNINHMHVTRLLPVGRGANNKEDLSPDMEEYKKILEEFQQKIRIMNQKIYYKREAEELFVDATEKTKFQTVTFASDQLNNVLHGYKVTGCGSGDATLSINYDGRVFPCTSLNDDDDCIGNIENDSIEEITKNGKEIADMLNVNNIPACKVCKFRYFCGGGCRACAKNHDGIMGKDPECERYQYSIMEYMWILKPEKATV